MKRLLGLRLLGLGLLLVLLQGCAGLSPEEALQYQEMEASGQAEKCKDVKSPTLAAALNILPPFGDLYLKGESKRQDVYWNNHVYSQSFNFGIALASPYAIPWAASAAYVTADNLNKRACIQTYRVPAYVEVDLNKQIDRQGNVWGDFTQKKGNRLESNRNNRNNQKYNMIVVGSPEYKELYQ